ncbi:hypothetical protein ACGFH8_11835 [Micromonospora sp. NPDC049175]|uniref:hypothetical protein n=1 Tax=Micromonospora sp. NPDC049175 TaxID=3364266 RepID=UPI003716672F
MSTYQGPWSPSEHPADWAYRTGRVTAESRETWRAIYDNDPDEAGRTIAELFPVLADPTMARLIAVSAEQERREQALDDTEFAGLFPPTVHNGVDDLDEFPGLFPPRRR